MEKILDFGKNKGKTISQCEPSYILWLSLHSNVLAEKNRWAAQEAFKILTAPSQEAQVCLELINSTYKCLCFARYKDDKKKYQSDLDSRINYLKEQYGHSVIEKHHEYIFA